MDPHQVGNIDILLMIIMSWMICWLLVLGSVPDNAAYGFEVVDNFDALTPLISEVARTH